MKQLTIFITAVLFLGLFWASPVFSFNSWENSPNNWENSKMNWENSEMNWKNSPMNYENSPMKYNNKRIIRDNQGNPEGYVVPKDDGGANVFDMDGDREGYVPDNDNDIFN